MPHEPVTNEDLESFYPSAWKSVGFLLLAVIAILGITKRHRRLNRASA